MKNKRFFNRNKASQFLTVCSLVITTTLSTFPVTVSAVSQFTNYPTLPENSFIGHWFADPSYPGQNSHGGMDISYTGYVTGDVYAANEGTVTQIETGCAPTKSTCGGSWGNHIIIDHGDGVSSVYAHLNKVLVATGEKVQGGQHIAMMGSSGWADGIHLHFEVLKNGQKVDPYSYLYWNAYTNQLSAYGGSANAPSGTAQLPPTTGDTSTSSGDSVQNTNPEELATLEGFGSLQNTFTFSEGQRNTKVTFRNAETTEEFIYTIEEAQNVELPYGEYLITIDGLMAEDGAFFDVKTATITPESPVSSVTADITSIGNNSSNSDSSTGNDTPSEGVNTTPPVEQPAEPAEVSITEIKNIIAGYEPINLEQLLHVSEDHLRTYFNDSGKDLSTDDTRRAIYDRIATDYPDLNLLTGDAYNSYRVISQEIINRSDYTFSDLNTAYPAHILSLYNQLLERLDGNIDETVKELLPLITQTRDAYIKRRTQRENGETQDAILLPELAEIVEEVSTNPEPVESNEPETIPEAPETPIEEIPEGTPETTPEEPTEPKNESSDQPTPETEQPSDNSEEVEVPTEDTVETPEEPSEENKEPVVEENKPAQIQQQIIAPEELSDLTVQYINKETEEIIEFKVGEKQIKGIEFGEYTVTVKDYIDPVSKQPLKIDYKISEDNSTLLTGFVLYVEGVVNNEETPDAPQESIVEEAPVAEESSSEEVVEPTPEPVEPETPEESVINDATTNDATNNNDSSSNSDNSSSGNNQSNSNDSNASSGSNSSSNNSDTQQPSFATTDDLNNQPTTPPAESQSESVISSESESDESVEEVDESINETSKEKTPLNLEANGLTVKPKNKEELITAKPKAIANGSTYKLEIDGKEKNVVLINVTTPSAGDSQSPAEKYGKESLERAKFLLENATSVEVEYDTGATKDSYNRDLAYVWVDGYLLQEILIKEGLAKLDPTKNQGNTRYLSNLTSVEAIAKSAKLGVWNSNNTATGVEKNSSVDGLTGITSPEETVSQSDSSQTNVDESKSVEKTSVTDAEVIPEASTGKLPETGFKLNPIWLFVSGIILTVGITLLFLQYRKHGSFAFITGKASEDSEDDSDDLMNDDFWGDEWEDENDEDDDLFSSNDSFDDDPNDEW